MSASRPDNTGFSVYRRLLTYSLKHWPMLLLSVLAMVATAATEPGFAALMKPLLDGSFVNKDPQTIRWAPVAIIVIFLVRGLSSFVSTYFMAFVGRAVVKTLRNDLFNQLQAMPVPYYDTASSGTLLSKLTYNVEQVAAASTDSITILVRDTFSILGLLGWMLYLDWHLTLGFLVLGPVISLLVAYVTRRFRSISRRIQNSMGEVTHVAEEMIEAHRVVKIFGGQAYETRRFDEVNERNRHLQMKMTSTRAANVPIVQFIVALALAAIVFVATRDNALQDITVGTFMSFMTAMLLLMPPIKRLTQVNAILQRGIAAGESIFDLLDTERERDTGTKTLVRARGDIHYRDVHFSYNAEKGEVLKGINLRIEPGQTVALIGRSGSGKTTIANLLPRFYEPGAGQILLDGTPINEYTLADLRKQIAYVGQDVTLFNDTIAHNIAYGALDTASEQDIRKAAEAAHALDFIEQLPQGLQTRVGENGVLLSGGQRQRLAIARALLKDAPILIMDEATSSLDSESERHIQAALETLLSNRSTLVIAHRLSTIENADNIIVMQDGQISETGTHHELLKQAGLYARLHRMQFHDTADG